MLTKPVFLPALLALTLTGCGPVFYDRGPDDENLVDVSFDAVDNLLLNLQGSLPSGSLVVINSLVNVDDLSQSVAFGRIMSDQISSAFHRAGYQIIGMKLPTEIFAANDAGILHLSDETKQALHQAGAAALVVGSYAAGKNNAYVSLKVFEIASERVISTTDLSVPMGPDAKKLLKPRKTETASDGELL